MSESSTPRHLVHTGTYAPRVSTAEVPSPCGHLPPHSVFASVNNMAEHMAAVAVSHETRIIGPSSSSFSKCSPTDDSFRIPQRTGMSILSSCKRMGASVRAEIGRVAHALRPNTRSWDVDFQVQTRNNSPRKPKMPTKQRRDVREESWSENWSWRRNVMSWTATLIVVAETRKTVPSLLVRGAAFSVCVFQSLAISTHAVLSP